MVSTIVGSQFWWQWDQIIFIYVTTLLAILSGMMTANIKNLAPHVDADLEVMTHDAGKQIR